MEFIRAGIGCLLRRWILRIQSLLQQSQDSHLLSFWRVAESDATLGRVQNANLLVAVGAKLDERHLFHPGRTIAGNIPMLHQCQRLRDAVSNTIPSEAGTVNSLATSRWPHLGLQREGPRSRKPPVMERYPQT